AATVSGYTKAETTGTPLVDNFIIPEYQEAVQGVLAKALRGSDTSNFEFPLTTKTGDQVFILLNATARRDTDGNITGVMGVGQDITELKKAMWLSESAADDLKRLIDSANAPILGIDTKGCVNEWNKK
ncbi:unnamed protein product, partial [Prorocentrum cordatum]